MSRRDAQVIFNNLESFNKFASLPKVKDQLSASTTGEKQPTERVFPICVPTHGLLRSEGHTTDEYHVEKLNISRKEIYKVW